MTRSDELSQRAHELFISADDKYPVDDASRVLAEMLSTLSLDYAETPGDTVPVSKAVLADILCALGQTLDETAKLNDALFEFTDDDIPSFLRLVNDAHEIVSGDHDKHHVRDIVLAVVVKFLLTNEVSPRLKQKLLDIVQNILAQFDEEMAAEAVDESRVDGLLAQME